MDVNVTKLNEFVQKHLDNDRVMYDCQEVEQIIRQAWFAGFADSEQRKVASVAQLVRASDS